MKLAVVYNPQDHKLTPDSYSWTYRDMFNALVARFAPVQHVTQSGSAQDIEADAIIFFDVHSSHDIRLDGVAKHPAVKYEYFDDPHQETQKGVYSNGQRFHKLGPVERSRRALERGVRFIICPYLGTYERFIAPHVPDGTLLWFPVAPKQRKLTHSLLSDRKSEVLANGHLWPGTEGFRPYDFRRWAFQRSGVTHIRHALDAETPRGYAYQAFLAQYAGALALSDTQAVPKYLEVPLAGCVCFLQELEDTRRMGFRDGDNCIVVDRENFDSEIGNFRKYPEEYQDVADNGRQLAEQYTADRFADFIYRHAEEHTHAVEN